MAGDFNARPVAPELGGMAGWLTDAWAAAGDGDGLTIPRCSPPLRPHGNGRLAPNIPVPVPVPIPVACKLGRSQVNARSCTAPECEPSSPPAYRHERAARQPAACRRRRRGSTTSGWTTPPGCTRCGRGCRPPTPPTTSRSSLTSRAPRRPLEVAPGTPSAPVLPLP
jgi:hypothetical protein